MSGSAMGMWGGDAWPLVTRATRPEEPRTRVPRSSWLRYPDPALSPWRVRAGRGWARVPWGPARRSWAFLLSLPSIPTATEEISLEVPANILEGSQRAHVTVMGKGQAGHWGSPGAGRVQSSMGQAQHGGGTTQS